MDKEYAYATIEELDEAVLNRLISRIMIGEVKKMDGQKVQEVRIVYNFVGGKSRRLQHKDSEALPCRGGLFLMLEIFFDEFF